MALGPSAQSRIISPSQVLNLMTSAKTLHELTLTGRRAEDVGIFGEAIFQLTSNSKSIASPLTFILNCKLKFLTAPQAPEVGERRALDLPQATPSGQSH